MNEGAYQIGVLVLGAIIVGLLFIITRLSTKAADGVPPTSFKAVLEFVQMLLTLLGPALAAKTPTAVDDEVLEKASLLIAELLKRYDVVIPPEPPAPVPPAQASTL